MADRTTRRSMLRGVVGLAAATGCLQKREPTLEEGWEDGLEPLSGWREYAVQGDGAAAVVEREGPAGGTRALRIRETTGSGTAFVVGTDRRLDGWDGKWTIAGAFHARRLVPHHPFLGHRVVPYYDPSAGTDLGASGLSIEVGMTDPRGVPTPVEFERRGLVRRSVERRWIDWDPDRWYAWQFLHDGDGRYEGWCWRLPLPASIPGPPAPHLVAVGDSPSGEARPLALHCNGAPGGGLVLEYAAVAHLGGKRDPRLLRRLLSASGDYLFE